MLLQGYPFVLGTNHDRRSGIREIENPPQALDDRSKLKFMQRHMHAPEKTQQE